MASKNSDAQSTHKLNEPASDSPSAFRPPNADMSPTSDSSSANRPPKADMSPASDSSSANRPKKADISPVSDSSSANRPKKDDISPASHTSSANSPKKVDISPASHTSSANRPKKADISPASGESRSCLITPPNISIGHMYVYNIGPDVTPSVIGPLKKGVKFQSPAASSGPICRICHEGDGREDLVSPCRCTGSVGLVHQSCMERWLSTRCSENDRCEICNYSFSTVRRPKSVIDYLKSDHVRGVRCRNMLGDLTCFLLLTPLAGVSTFLCVEGAKRQVIWGNSLEAGCFMALATFLFTIYTVWNLLTFRYHLKGFLKWRSRNHNVKLIRVQRRSASLDDDHPVLPQNTQGIPQPSNNSSGAQMTAVTITSENRISDRRSPLTYNSEGTCLAL